MTIGKLHNRRTPGIAVTLGVAGALALLSLTGCQAQQASAPPPGAITADRALGDIMVRFRPPAVTESLEAGRLLAQIEGPVRFVVKRPMSGGTWLVTAITPSADITLDQAVDTLRAAPRVEIADPDRILKPNRRMPTGRDASPD